MSKVWQPAYVGIGSNLADPRSQVVRAFERLASIEGVRLVMRSRLYGSRPLGPPDQPDYINAAAGLLTWLEPQVLLAELRAVERAFGRPLKRVKWGPRVLDLDLLIYAGVRRSGRQLTLPHPGIAERNFVLYPLADFAPELDVPGLGRVADLKARVSPEGLWPLGDDTTPTAPLRATA